MLVTRISQLSRSYNSLELDVTQEQLDAYERGEGYLQTIFPNLTAPEREFLKSGISPKEWSEMFGSVEDFR